MSRDNNAWLKLQNIRWYAHDAIKQGDTSPALADLAARLDDAVRSVPDVSAAFKALEAALTRHDEAQWSFAEVEHGSDEFDDASKTAARASERLQRALNRARSAAGLPIHRRHKGRRAAKRAQSTAE